MKRREETDNFYEVMPGTTDRQASPEDEAKLISIITIALVALVLAAFILLFLQGLDIITGSH